MQNQAKVTVKYNQPDICTRLFTFIVNFFASFLQIEGIYPVGFPDVSQSGPLFWAIPELIVPNLQRWLEHEICLYSFRVTDLEPLFLTELWVWLFKQKKLPKTLIEISWGDLGRPKMRPFFNFLGESIFSRHLTSLT